MVVTDTPARRASSGWVSPLACLRAASADDRVRAAAARSRSAGRCAAPATRGLALRLGPGVRTPSVTRMRSARRQVSVEYPVTRLSAAPLGAGSPGRSVPLATWRRTTAATRAYLGRPLPLSVLALFGSMLGCTGRMPFLGRLSGLLPCHGQ